MGEKFLNKFFYPIVTTRLHVAFIYYFICIGFFQVFTEDYTKYLPVCLAFSMWHYALYLFDKAYDSQLDKMNYASESIPGRLAPFFMALSVALALTPIFILWYSDQPVIPFLFFLPVTFLYNLRIFPGGKAIKHFTLWKNLYSAVLIWPLPVAVMMKYYAGVPNYLAEIMFWFWNFVLYVLIAEIIWDMRDVNGDRQDGLRTIPVLLGIPKTRILLLGVLFLVFLPLLILKDQFDPVVFGFYILYTLISGPKLPKWLFHLPLFISLAWYIHRYGGDAFGY
jgi:4-hydroxybenzoate polyprenyltransferase